MPDLARCLWAVCVASLATRAIAADPAYVGASVCAACHEEQAAAQATSAHAHSLYPAAAHPMASSFTKPGWVERDGRFRFRFHRTPDGQLRAQGYDDRNTIDVPVEWALGAGRQAVTFVTRVDSQWHLEHHFSYYSALGGLAPTPGHRSLRASSLAEAMGLLYKTTDPTVGIIGCIECHSTGPVTVKRDGILLPNELGVRCEACHGPGGAHVAAVRSGATSGKVRQAIGNPKRLPPAALNHFCGRCHRPPASSGEQIDWNYAWNVRHQPVYLSNSRCFTQSKESLSCFGCHPPHREPEAGAVRAANHRCRGCHLGGAAQKPPAACGETARGNCVDCHMPRVSPEPGLRFTNHWIGVYRSGAGLRPR